MKKSARHSMLIYISFFVAAVLLGAFIDEVNVSHVPLLILFYLGGLVAGIRFVK
ncbi:hypothetical protein [Cytobacillus gottheilii]|uniref:hypothetical protein n=1 Tax=Cytobacillus gottheilii TaxID=859144 RepID=UPI0015945B66|nr:hypothetical protein [Cytobacillus gottheilii]